MNEKQIQKYLELNEQGLSIAEIAKKIKVSMAEIEDYEIEQENERLKAEFVELRAKGKSIEEIAEELKISKDELIELTEDWTIELHNSKSVEIDAVQKRYYISKDKRVEAFGTLLLSVKGELEKRDFADISTDKLLAFYLKLGEFLKNEETTVEVKRQGSSGKWDVKEWNI